MIKKGQLSRRGFLKKAGVLASGAIGFPLFVPSSALGKDGNVAASNRITVGFIGLGQHGTAVNLTNFISHDDVQVVALCDVNMGGLRGYHSFGHERGLEPAVRIVKQHYSAKNGSGTFDGVFATQDWREIIARDDLDAVVISTPDHWHIPISLAAIRTGKDVYCEKPLTHTIQQGRILSDTVKRYNRVFQTGSGVRARSNYHRAAELVQNGRIGKVIRLETYLPPWTGPFPAEKYKETPIMPIPKGFDYDMWLGPAPWAPYTEGRCHWNFRWIFDYSGGMLTDMGGHYADQLQWANGTEYTGPVEVYGFGEFPTDGIYNTAMQFHVEYTYADGSTAIVSSRYAKNGVRYEGSDGWITVGGGSGGGIDAYPKSILKSIIKPDELHLYTSFAGPERNFIDCVQSRHTPFYPAEVGHRTATVCHLGNISMLLGRKLKWDPEKEVFVNDAEANRMLSRPMRSPWCL